MLPAFGDFPLGSITNLAVREWIAGLSGRGLAPATVQKAHQTLSKILRSAVDANLLAHNPSERVPLPRVERQEMRVLTPPEITALSETMTPRYSALVTFAAYSGLRLGELAGLRRNRLSLQRHHVRVSEIAVEVRGELFRGPPKTRAGNRTVPLPGFVVDTMAEHLERFAAPVPDGPVFPGAEGGTLRASQWRNRHWAPAVRDAGLAPLRPHGLRHTAVSLWIAAGAAPNQIATWAGHTSVSVVLDRYGHLFPGHEREVSTDSNDWTATSPDTPASTADVHACPRVFAGFPRADAQAASPSARRAPSDLRFPGGRYWSRTSDLCRVKAALYR